MLHLASGYTAQTSVFVETPIVNRLRSLSTVALICCFAFLPLCAQEGAQPPAQQTSRASTDPWWKHAVIYEIYPRSFQDSNGDSVGDINGITSRLDYLKDLGIDAIWITPMHPSPQVDFGYDIADYEAIDPQYGTMADFEHMVSKAKKRNIRVIM